MYFTAIFFLKITVKVILFALYCQRAEMNRLKYYIELPLLTCVNEHELRISVHVTIHA